MPGVYSNVSPDAVNVSVSASGWMQRNSSSIKYKKDIENLSDEYADKLLELRPVYFKSTCENDNPDHGMYGLIAEEVAQIDPRLVFWKDVERKMNEETGKEELVEIEPQAEGVKYQFLTMHLINIVKRLNSRIEALENA